MGPQIATALGLHFLLLSLLLNHQRQVLRYNSTLGIRVLSVLAPLPQQLSVQTILTLKFPNLKRVATNSLFMVLPAVHCSALVLLTEVFVGVRRAGSAFWMVLAPVNPRMLEILVSKQLIR